MADRHHHVLKCTSPQSGGLNSEAIDQTVKGCELGAGRVMMEVCRSVSEKRAGAGVTGLPFQTDFG